MRSSKQREIELQQAINLPEDIEIKSFLGRGRRSFSYSGKYKNADVVVKVYRQEFIEKYKQKASLDIAKFEFERNTSLYNIDSIRPYIAKPYKYFAAKSGFTHSFVQQFIEGITLKQLIYKLGYLPDNVLQVGKDIVYNAELNGIHDLDISVGNVLVRKENDIWIPKLYDFNMLPQYMSPPNLFMALGFKIGLRRKSHRDYRSLKNWDRRGKNKKWIGRN